MGEGLVEAVSSPPTRSYTEIFEEAFPWYFYIGMTYDQFWRDDCNLVKLYRKIEEIRQEQVNREAWLQGAYIYESLLRVSPVLNAFGKKNAKPMPYLEEPFKTSVAPEENKDKRPDKNRFDRAQAFMTKFMTDTNKKMERK